MTKNKISAIICVGLLALSLSACANSSLPDESTVETTAISETEEYAETTAETPQTTVAEAPHTTRPEVEPSLYEDFPSIETTDEVQLALDFIKAFYDYYYCIDEQGIDLNKYFSDGYLKQYVDLYFINTRYSARGKDSRNYAIDFISAHRSDIIDDTNYISLKYIISSTSGSDNSWGSSGFNATIAVRAGDDGPKIVDLAVDCIGGNNIAPYWDEEYASLTSNEQKGYDIREHENPWDNDEYAQAIIKGYKEQYGLN